MKVYIILDEPDEFGFRVFVKKVFSDKEKLLLLKKCELSMRIDMENRT